MCDSCVRYEATMVKNIEVMITFFAASKNLVVKGKMFPQQNIHNYTWTSPTGKTHNQIDCIFIYIGAGSLVYSMYDLSGDITVVLITIWWLQKLGKV
jgi:hypothetical protein